MPLLVLLSGGTHHGEANSEKRIEIVKTSDEKTTQMPFGEAFRYVQPGGGSWQKQDRLEILSIC